MNEKLKRFLQNVDKDRDATLVYKHER